MTESALIAIAAALCIVGSIIFPAISQGKVASAAMETIARQPDTAGEVRSTLIVSMALLEALTIYGLLIAFVLTTKI